MFEHATAETVYLKDYQPPAYQIDTVDLVFYLYEEGTRVRSRLTVRRVADEATSLTLQGEGLKQTFVRLNGSELSAADYRIDEKSLTLLDPPETFVLETEVELEPENNTALQGLYRSGGIFCTQCEAEGFRRITWYLDRPDVMARFITRIEADKQRYPVLLSNGNPVESGDLPDGRHYAIWEDPFPKPSYLFALVAGDLKYIEQGYTTASGKNVQLRIYVEPENIQKCDHAMRSLVNAMAWDEENYGREYDLDVFNIVAVNDFNMGAMENKGLNIFNSKYVLASPETATDQDYLDIEAVVAHEYFHNWTGNRITCRDWFQLSLKEGFTVFRDQEFSADMGSRSVKRIEDVGRLKALQFAEDAGPMAHPVRPASYMEINNFYTLTVYEKGAEVVRMQANLLAPEKFRSATDLYFNRFDGQAVTTDDFVQCMEEVSGIDMSQFKRWYDFAGTPEVRVTGDFDPQGQTYTLSLSQHVPATPGQTDKPPFHIPVAVGLLDNEGNDLPLKLRGSDDRGDLLQLIKPQQQFVFEGISRKPTPSLLRGFSAPVKINFGYTDEQLMFLMANDSDGFNRWEAGQELAQRVLLELAADYRRGGSPGVPESFIQAFGDTMWSAAEPALLAEVLTLPTEGYLGDQMSVVDVDSVHQAHQRVKMALGEFLKGDLLDLYQQLDERGEYRLDFQSMGRRRLKNRLLSYLMADGCGEAGALCLEQYEAKHNMTDVMAALVLITDSDLPERQLILDEFADRWQGDPLVMDKWFSIQAVSCRPDTLSRVRELCGHPAFSIRNPNKVYALISRFAAANPVRFHAADGSGYKFLTDKVLEVDELNPQVAARLLRNMARWRRYDEGRQAMMRRQLERVISNTSISKDVFEVATKSLEG